MIRQITKIDICENRRISYRGRGQYGQNYRKDHIMLITTEMIIEEIISEICKITEVKILEVELKELQK